MPTIVSTPAPARNPKILDQVRDALRRKHFSLRAEQAYLAWIRRFILFHKKRHPLIFLASFIRVVKCASGDFRYAIVLFKGDCREYEGGARRLVSAVNRLQSPRRSTAREFKICSSSGNRIFGADGNVDLQGCRIDRIS